MRAASHENIFRFLKGEYMKVCAGKVFSFSSLFFILLLISLPDRAATSDIPGEALFKQHCAVCHPDGGNVINPQKTLHKKDLAANNIRTAEDIVKKMRNPGPVPTHPQEWGGMKIFDEKKISDEDALKIAEYVMSKFK